MATATGPALACTYHALDRIRQRAIPPELLLAAVATAPLYLLRDRKNCRRWKTVHRLTPAQAPRLTAVLWAVVRSDGRLVTCYLDNRGRD